MVTPFFPSSIQNLIIHAGSIDSTTIEQNHVLFPFGTNVMPKNKDFLREIKRTRFNTYSFIKAIEQNHA